MKEIATINFTNKREEYEIGDTITVKLDSNEKAVYELVRIEPVNNTPDKH